MYRCINKKAYIYICIDVNYCMTMSRTPNNRPTEGLARIIGSFAQWDMKNIHQAHPISMVFCCASWNIWMS